MHGGSNNLDEQYFNNISKRFFKIAKEIMDELNIEFEYVDIGGGFGVPYRENEKTLNMENVAMNIVENFKDIIKKEDIELMVEPGRYLVADSTVLLGRGELFQKVQPLWHFSLFRICLEKLFP